MSGDKSKHTDVNVSGPVMVEIDAEKIAAIIFAVCHTTEARSARAANLIIDLLIEAHQNASRPE
jgi:hypothetical protein